jgi:hypothetical protein
VNTVIFICVLTICTGTGINNQPVNIRLQKVGDCSRKDTSAHIVSETTEDISEGQSDKFMLH